MVWSKQQIEIHKETVKLLYRIKDEAFDYIRSEGAVSELQVQRFIISRFNVLGLTNQNLEELIVAFDENAANPHYRPTRRKNKTLGKKGIVMIDIWGRQKGTRMPYGDITWMAARGKVPKHIQQAFDVVLASRDAGLRYLRRELRKNSLPSGNQVHEVCDQVLIDNGYENAIKHSTGHSIGTESPHGCYGHLTNRHEKVLRKNLGYTIEPGLYLDGKFGVRSEIDFFIENKKVIVTGPVQRDWVRL